MKGFLSSLLRNETVSSQVGLRYLGIHEHGGKETICSLFLRVVQCKLKGKHIITQANTLNQDSQSYKATDEGPRRQIRVSAECLSGIKKKLEMKKDENREYCETELPLRSLKALSADFIQVEHCRWSWFERILSWKMWIKTACESMISPLHRQRENAPTTLNTTYAA